MIWLCVGLALIGICLITSTLMAIKAENREIANLQAERESELSDLRIYLERTMQQIRDIRSRFDDSNKLPAKGGDGEAV